MIDINIYRNNEGHIVGYAVSGHQGERGSSIVCAGISVLAQSILKGLAEHFINGLSYGDVNDEDAEELKEHLSYRIGDGELSVELKCEPDDVTDALLETMLIGMYDVKDADECGGSGVSISEWLADGEPRKSDL